MYMGSDGRVPAWIMPGPDEIAHSAASQRGREGRRKRWWKVCVKSLVENLIQRGYYHEKERFKYLWLFKGDGG